MVPSISVVDRFSVWTTRMRFAVQAMRSGQAIGLVVATGGGDAAGRRS